MEHILPIKSANLFYTIISAVGNIIIIVSGILLTMGMMMIYITENITEEEEKKQKACKMIKLLDYSKILAGIFLILTGILTLIVLG